jgi:heme exporter protein A
MLRAEGLYRAFGPIVALDGVSFSLDAGESLTVFGPNGAGKSTLLRTLAGLLRPQRGTVYVDGARYDGRNAAQRRRIGWISHQSLLYDALTASENLIFVARLHGVDRPTSAARAALERVGLGDRIHAPVRTLSRGMVQRTAIARSLLHEPGLLLLDEPFTGLDVDAARGLRELLTTEIREGHAVVQVTHNVEEGLELASRVAVQRAGRFVAYGPRSAFDAAAVSSHYRTGGTDA